MGLSRLVGMGLAVLALVSPALAADITVPGDFQNLQDALDAARPGDRVLVQRGTHRGTFRVEIDGVEVEAHPEARFIVDRGGEKTFVAFRVSGYGATLRGLRVHRGGVVVTGDRVTVEDCEFRRL